MLKEGPNKVNTEGKEGDGDRMAKGRYEVWYYYGTLSRDEMIAIDQAAGKALALLVIRWKTSGNTCGATT